MALAEPFNTFALYPGQRVSHAPGYEIHSFLMSTQESGRLYTQLTATDPAITLTNSLKKVTLPWATVQPLIWNMKEWSVACSMTLSATVTVNFPVSGTSTSSLGGSLSASGKFAWLGQAAMFPPSTDSAYEIYSTNKEPKEKVIGAWDWKLQNTFLGDDSGVRDGAVGILPPVSTSFEFTGGGTSGSLTGSVGSPESGSFTAACSITGSGFSGLFSITPIMVWVKVDGNCEVYFTIGVSVTASPGADFGPIDIPASGSGDGTLTGTFLGESFTCPLKTSGLYELTEEGFSGSASSTGTCSYDITVSESWTYPT